MPNHNTLKSHQQAPNTYRQSTKKDECVVTKIFEKDNLKYSIEGTYIIPVEASNDCVRLGKYGHEIGDVICDKSLSYLARIVGEYGCVLMLGMVDTSSIADKSFTLPPVGGADNEA